MIDSVDGEIGVCERIKDRSPNLLMEKSCYLQNNLFQFFHSAFMAFVSYIIPLSIVDGRRTHFHKPRLI